MHLPKRVSNRTYLEKIPWEELSVLTVIQRDHVLFGVLVNIKKEKSCVKMLFEEKEEKK